MSDDQNPRHDMTMCPLVTSSPRLHVRRSSRSSRRLRNSSDSAGQLHLNHVRVVNTDPFKQIDGRQLLHKDVVFVIQSVSSWVDRSLLSNSTSVSVELSSEVDSSVFSIYLRHLTCYNTGLENQSRTDET
jgi:hypothetical protein